MSESLQIERSGHVARIALNRPGVHNAFDEELIAELTAALLDAERDPQVRAVVLTGTGTSFSAGADLNWMRSMSQAFWYLRYLGSLIWRLLAE